MAFTDPDRQAAYRFAPGQFNMLTVFGLGEAPISISSDAEDRASFQHTIRHVGRVTNAIQRMGVGDTLWVRGPYGNGWPLAQMEGRNVLVVAGGIGLAPLRPVIYYLLNHPEKFNRAEILYGARTPADMLFSNQLLQWQTEKVKVRLTVDQVPNGDAWAHRVGVVTTLFQEMDSQPANTLVVTCGPEIMMRFVVKGLMERGFEASQIYVSLERRMNCGISKCGKCQLGPKYVCRDGPVFAFAELTLLPEPVLV
ncbi:MAG: FAD/NAD(P)-binding protein [Clostridia bacterium]|nr:FAD/NAD(P)-binding protein [Clostridia bacterium]